MINWDLVNDFGEWMIPLVGLTFAAFVYFGGLVNVAGGAL